MERISDTELLEEIRKSLLRIEDSIGVIRAQVAKFEGYEDPTFDLDSDFTQEAAPELQETPESITDIEPETKEEPQVAPEVIPEPEPIPEPKPEPVFEGEESFAWKTDLPGSPVRNILSAISLNDRLLFINNLFEKDPAKFQATISTLNSLSSFAEGEAYILENYSGWKMSSEVVYRFMMAVRRKLK